MEHYNNDILTKNMIQKYGFRSFIDVKYQSWGSFTGQLFDNDLIRREFDKVEFHFDMESNNQHSCVVKEDRDSLEAAYFGRPIEVTFFHFPVTEKLEDRLQLISGVLDELFKEKQKYSRPQLLIESLTEKTIFAYYIWQYSE